MRYWLFLLTLPFLLAASPPSAAFLTRPVILPIEVVHSGHIAIHAKINGHGPYRFIFDTGSPSLVISEQVARDSKILSTDFDRPFFTPLGNLGEYPVRSITMGRATQGGLIADVWNHPTVELLGKMYGRFEGLIGFPFFAHYQLTIDYKTKTMMLVPSKYKPQDTKQKLIDRLSAPGIKFWAPTESIGIAVSKAKDDQAAGVVIDSVLSESPAANGGLKAGDRLLTLDGRWTDSVDDCYAALTAIDSARAVPMSILRDGRQFAGVLNVKPGI